MASKRAHPEMTSEVDDYDCTSRSRANSSEGQLLLKDIKTTGLVFVSKINHRNRCFIPSVKNYFGGVQVKKVLVDSGCSTILLPVAKNELEGLFDMFPNDRYTWRVGGSTGVGGGTKVLLVESVDRVKFEVKLCQDIIGHPHSVCVQTLRFSLCSEDAGTILRNPDMVTRFGTKAKSTLEEYANSSAPRRSHALLGQSVLKQLSCVKHSRVEFHVDPAHYEISSWNEVSCDTSRLLEQIILPDDFEDWEDDDNLCHDENEDYECVEND
jgi:hypothetical protein